MGCGGSVSAVATECEKGNNDDNKLDSPSSRVRKATDRRAWDPNNFETSPARRKSRLNSRVRRMSSIMGDFESSLKGLLGDKAAENSDQMSSEEQLKQLFNVLASTNKDGTTRMISLTALEEGFARMGMMRSAEDITRMFQLSDKDRSGTIDWNEFKVFFKHLVNDVKPGGEDINEVMLQAALLDRKQGNLQPQKARSWAKGKRPLTDYNIKYIGSRMTRIRALVCSPNRPIVAVADQESSDLSIIDISTSEVVRMTRGVDSVVCVALSSDKKAAVTTFRDSTVVLWDMTVGCVTRELEHPGVVTCSAFSPDGRFLITGCQDNICRKYQVSKGRLVRMTDKLPQMAKGLIVSLAYQNMEGNTFAITRSNEDFVRVISSISFLQMHTLRGHTAMVWNCVYTYDGRSLVSHCDRLIKVWDPIYRQCHTTFDLLDIVKTRSEEFNDEHMIWTAACIVSRAFDHIVAAVASSNCILFLNTCDSTVLLSLSTPSAIYCISSGGDYDYVCCGDEYGNVNIVSVR